MPKVKDVQPYIKETIASLKDTEGVKSVHIWGSYAKNINRPNTRIKDVDVLAKTDFHSGDLIAIDNKIIKDICSDSFLENQGYDPSAVKFSKKFLTFAKYNVDCWAISGDRKLVHWGPICTSKQEADAVNKEAERYASKNTGTEKRKVSKASEHIRKNWYNHYCKYLDQCFEGMPTGWYKAEEIKIREIISQTIRI
jgi:predicted nucleotidyltransferase